MDCSPEGKSARRLHAFHLLLIAGSPLSMSRNRRRSERTVRLSEERFNAQGIDGLIYRPRSGRPRELAKETVASVILPVVDDPGAASQTHWTVTKLCGWLEEAKDLDLSYSTLLRYLHEQEFARRISRALFQAARPGEGWQKLREDFAVELGHFACRPHRRGDLRRRGGLLGRSSSEAQMSG